MADRDRAPADKLRELRGLFLKDLSAGYRHAHVAYERLLKSPLDADAVRELREFFHRIAGTARNAELPTLGHLATVAEGVSYQLSLGKGEPLAFAQVLADSLAAVEWVLSHQDEETQDPLAPLSLDGLVVPEAIGEGRELSKVLIIDDDEFSAGLIDNVLRSAGFLSSYCCDPTRALNVIEEQLPDLIILDVVMPGLDGFELCRRVRTHPALQFTPIIFVTRRGDVEQRVRGLEVGANDYIGKPFEPQELIARVRSHLLRLANLREMAIRDGLTRCFNHKFLRMRLDQETARARRYNQELSVAMLDIDRFKSINDTHGHVCGDAVLANLAAIIAASVRSTDIVARYGGEEFTIVLVHAGLHEASVVCERLRARIEQHQFTFTSESSHANAVTIGVSASIGIAALDANTKNWMELIQTADKALYAAKQGGRNRVVTIPAVRRA